MKKKRLVLTWIGSLLIWACVLAGGTDAAGPAAGEGLTGKLEAANFWHRRTQYKTPAGTFFYNMVAQASGGDLRQQKDLGIVSGLQDFAPAALGRPITFTTADDTGGVDEFGPGIRNRRVENNALCFDVGPDAYLMWGNFDGKHPGYGYKPFGTAYLWSENGRWYSNVMAPYTRSGIYLRVRQSRPESTWRIVTGPNPEYNALKPGAAPGGYTAEFKVTGTDWQTISVLYSDKVKDNRSKPTDGFNPFGSLAIYPGDPGNRVEIAWIKITEGIHVYARRVIDLPAPVKEAKIHYRGYYSHTYVNGRLVAGPGYAYGDWGYRTIDLAKFLKPGRNVIAIHQYWSNPGFRLTGAVICTDGSYVPLTSWRPMKVEGSRWVPDTAVDDFQINSPFAGPWKTSFLTARPGEGSRFMEVDYDDGDWAELTATREAYNWFLAISYPYSGLIEVDLPAPGKTVFNGAPDGYRRLNPVFSEREPVELVIRGLRPDREPADYTLDYRLTDEQTGREIEHVAAALRAPANTTLFRREGLAPGAYELKMVLSKQGRVMDERSYEFVVAGSLRQPLIEGNDILEGLTLTRVVEIDCAAPPEEGGFIGLTGAGRPSATVVKHTPFGSYRETGAGNGDCFSYRVRLKNPGKPHLLEVTYPDDTFRIQGVFYTELAMTANRPPRALPRCSLGVLAGWPAPPGGRMKKSYGLFWPVDTLGTVDVFTTNYVGAAQAPAAASRFAIYEIEGDIPKVRIHDYPGQFKPIGVHSERGPYVLWETYYGGRNNAGQVTANHLFERPDFYADWYNVSANFVRMLGFHGLNFYFAGQHMYGGTLFPSRYDSVNNNSNSPPSSQRDGFCVLAAVMAENGCGFMSSLEFINNVDILMEGLPSRTQLAAGKPTLAQVTKSGAALPGNYIGLLPNYAHPKVEELLLTEVDELIALYREYPAWKGINFVLNTLCGPSYGQVDMDPLAVSYDDVSIARFEKETGVKVPVAAGAPDRFARRYAFLMSDAGRKEKWIQWRCDVLLAVNRRIRDKIKAVRPDCSLYLNICYPYDTRKMENVGDPEKLRRYIMRWGWDIEAYRREPGMAVCTIVFVDSDNRNLSTGKKDQIALKRGETLAPEYLRFFADDGRGGLDLRMGFTENWPQAEKGLWLWTGPAGATQYHWPAGAAFNDYWTNVISRVHPAFIQYAWADTNLDSRIEQGFRRFAREWRALPNGRYETLSGNGRDRNIVIRRCRDRSEYWYLANPAAWSVRVTLSVRADAAVTELGGGRPVKLSRNGSCEMILLPYAVRSLRITDSAGGEIIGARAVVDQAAVEELAVRLESEKKAASAFAEETDNPDGAAFAARVAGLERSFRGGDYLLVEQALTGGYDYALAKQKASSFKKEAAGSRPLWRIDPAAFESVGSVPDVPFLLLGPFPNRERKGFDSDFGPEADFTAGRAPAAAYPAKETETSYYVRTQSVGPDGGRIDLLPLFGTRTDYLVCYALTGLESARDRDVLLVLGSDDGIKVWLNGRLEHSNQAQRSGRFGQDVVPVRLKKGLNRVLLKIDNTTGGWNFFFAVADRNGKPAGSLKYTRPEPETAP